MGSGKTQGKQSVAVVGAGAWGTALALVAHRAGNAVTLLARDVASAERLARERVNIRLPGATLPTTLRIGADPAILAESQLWLIAVPAQATRSVIDRLKPYAPANLSVIITAKGIERETDQFLTRIVEDQLPAAEPLILSGPSFAADVARELPTAVTLAARSLAIAQKIAPVLRTASFRPYTSNDLIGVQLGGAIKNVLAIASGIVSGRRLGESAKAALIARSFAELTRFGQAFGARPETLMGLSGLGDLVLTSSSAQSRNFALGFALGQGEALATAVDRNLSEGFYTTAAACELAERHGIDVPIMRAVARVLSAQSDVDAEVAQLMQRPLKPEFP